MSIERVIVTFVLVGIALFLAIVLMPVTGSILFFLVTVVGGAYFLVKGLQNLRTYSAPRPPDPDEPPAPPGDNVRRLVPRRRTPPEPPANRA